MAADIRTVLKNINRDLLIEEISASALPFVTANTYGFEKSNRFESVPAAEPRRISSVLQRDGSYLEDFAQPGEIRFEFTTPLTVADGIDLDSFLFAHNSTQHTAEQQRENQDESDLDALITQYPNVDTMNITQLRNYVRRLARVVLREHRQPAI